MLLKNITKYTVIIFLILAILTVYGVDVTSVLAGLGIVGVVLGFALQDLAKDIIAGLVLFLKINMLLVIQFLLMALKEKLFF